LNGYGTPEFASQTAGLGRRADRAPPRMSVEGTQLSVFEGLSKQATSFDSLRDGVVLYEIMQGLYGQRAPPPNERSDPCQLTPVRP